jgi:hypothetical protein
MTKESKFVGGEDEADAIMRQMDSALEDDAEFQWHQDGGSLNNEPQQPDAIWEPTDHVPSLVSAVDKHSADGAASLDHVRQSMLAYSREQQDKIISSARDKKVINLLPLDKSIGATKEQEDAAFKDESGTYGHIERMNNGPP